MDAAQTRELGIFKPGNHFENSSLRAVFHLGLKAHHVVERAKRIVAAQLHHRIGFVVRRMRVGQANGFHRAKAQGFTTAFGHDLDRQAAIEIGGGFALVEFGLVGGQKRVDERLVLVAGHRAVEIGGAFFFGFALVIARLHPGAAHVDAVVIDDRRDGVEKRQRIRAGFLRDRLAQTLGSQRAGGDDPVAAIGQGGDFARFHGDQRVCLQCGGNRGGKGIAVHGQGAARRQAVLVGGLHDKPTRRAHLPMQQAHGVLFVIIRAEGVGTDHLGQIAGAVGEGFDLGAHFVDHHAHAHPGCLPCGLGPGHAAANDMQNLCHGLRCRALARD